MKHIILFFFLLTVVTLSQTYNDPLFPEQDNLTSIRVPDVWSSFQNFGNPDVVIAVFGYGVDINHPDLDDNIFINEQEIPGNGIDDDGNGYIDDINGWNFVDNNSNVLPDGSIFSYHETEIAGIIAAEINNNEGIIGVAPNCKILPVKFYYSAPDYEVISNTLIASFEYVKGLQLQYPQKRFIINISYGFDSGDLNEQLIEDAIAECYSIGISVFASTGNKGSSFPVEFPANSYYTICITGSVGVNYNFVGNYNSGPEVDFAAPYRAPKTTSYNHGYIGVNGTSYATPLAAGLAALIMSYDKTISPDAIKAILIQTAVKIDPEHANYVNGHSLLVGYGKIDALDTFDSMFSITFSNDIESANFGEITVNNITHPSGYTDEFFNGSFISVEAYDGLYNNGNLVTKFHNWNYLNPPEARSRLNYLEADPSQTDITALFKKTKPLTVRNYFEGGNGDSILFGESTLSGDVINRSSPYSENAFIYNEENVPAVYRAEAPPTHTNLFGTNWNFVKWENGLASITREDSITESSPPEWRAMYKGHLKSDNQSGISSNSQRKLVRTDNGIYHLVYESLGEVWYTESTTADFHGSWIQDFNLSAEYEYQSAKNPSIDYYGNSLAVVFEGINPSDEEKVVCLLHNGSSWLPAYELAEI